MNQAIIAYIPALHQGYINFLKKYSGATLFVLGSEVVREIPRLERDIRAIVPEEIQKAIQSLSIVSDVFILRKENISDIKKFDKLILPDEDVSRYFIETYLPDTNVVYDSVFLRWDKFLPTKEMPPSPARIISKDSFDKEIMAKAFAESKKSSDWWRQIGAVIVKGGKPVLAGYNRPLPSDHVHNIFGDPRSNLDAGTFIEVSKFIHAEAGLIALAAKKGIALEGASLYVTTFPCPLCAKSISLTGIKKVFYSKGYSLLDAEDVLKAAGIELVFVEDSTTQPA